MKIPSPSHLKFYVLGRLLPSRIPPLPPAAPASRSLIHEHASPPICRPLSKAQRSLVADGIDESFAGQLTVLSDGIGITQDYTPSFHINFCDVSKSLWLYARASGVPHVLIGRRCRQRYLGRCYCDHFYSCADSEIDHFARWVDASAALKNKSPNDATT